MKVFLQHGDNFLERGKMSIHGNIPSPTIHAIHIPGNFHIRNVCTFNFHYVAKWQKLSGRERIFRAFNFCHLRNWRKKI